MPRPLNALVLFILFATAGCKVGDEINDLFDLPEATTTGQHTVGCKVDGAIWLPYAEHTLDRAIEPEYDSTYFRVRLERETGDIPLVYFTIADSTGIREGKTYSIRDGFYATVSVKTNDSMMHDELSTLNGADLDGSVTITKVKQPSGQNFKMDGILSGTFHFTARSGFTTRKVAVTEGRFDFALR